MIISEQDRWKNGGSYRKYHYTVKDISEITGRVLGTIRNDISKKSLIMSDLVSVSMYLQKFRDKEKCQKN